MIKLNTISTIANVAERFVSDQARTTPSVKYSNINILTHWYV